MREDYTENNPDVKKDVYTERLCFRPLASNQSPLSRLEGFQGGT